MIRYKVIWGISEYDPRMPPPEYSYDLPFIVGRKTIHKPNLHAAKLAATKIFKADINMQVWSKRVMRLWQPQREYESDTGRKFQYVTREFEPILGDNPRTAYIHVIWEETDNVE